MKTINAREFVDMHLENERDKVVVYKMHVDEFYTLKEWVKLLDGKFKLKNIPSDILVRATVKKTNAINNLKPKDKKKEIEKENDKK